MGKVVRLSLLLFFLGLMIMILVVYRMYGKIFVSNVSLPDAPAIIYLPQGATFPELLDSLQGKGALVDEEAFVWVARKKKFGETIKPGRFKITDGMSNNDLVNMFRSGRQDPVMVVFNNIRTLDQLAGKVSRYLEGDSAAFADWLLQEDLPGTYGFRKETFPAMFLPNTYSFYWTSSPQEFCERMHTEYLRFWEGDRDRKAEKIGLSREEVSTLASIVEEETLHSEENRRVAGVYMNRLENGIPLQADPTLKFALGDFGRQRILNVDKAIESPYNTYKYKGLPPGPIRLPSIEAVDAVLDYEKHKYLYFCAKSDFSGNHAFARTLAEHGRNAREYQRALDRRRIYR
ncbi:MAG: endolytic transglycosylase MltG [Bacteroidales bacterium]